MQARVQIPCRQQCRQLQASADRPRGMACRMRICRALLWGGRVRGRLLCDADEQSAPGGRVSSRPDATAAIGRRVPDSATGRPGAGNGCLLLGRAQVPAMVQIMALRDGLNSPRGAEQRRCPEAVHVVSPSRARGLVWTAQARQRVASCQQLRVGAWAGRVCSSRRTHPMPCTLGAGSAFGGPGRRPLRAAGASAAGAGSCRPQQRSIGRPGA
eukprot:354460-Chlamydomonas_euryale.AAC.9